MFKFASKKKKVLRMNQKVTKEKQGTKLSVTVTHHINTAGNNFNCRDHRTTRIENSCENEHISKMV